MPRRRFQRFIALFNCVLRYSFVPAGIGVAAARSGRPTLPSDRRAAALHWTVATTATGLRILGLVVRSVTITVSLVSAASSAATAQTVSPHRPPVIEPRADPFADFVAEASRRFAIPASWISAVIQVESNGDPIAVSPKGAMGLMQLMPETWTSLRARYRLGADPFDPRDNILVGAAYLRQMYDRFGETGFLAAYNAGPSHYEKHLAGQPLLVETQDYLAKLASLLGDGEISGSVLANKEPFAWSRSPLFVGPATNESAHDIAHNDFATDVQTGRISADHPVGETFALAPHSNGLFVRRMASGESP
jgi:hypothetical protein